jgi:hypothetical protein
MSAHLRLWAAALGGEVSGKSVRAPGPGHSARDRSLSRWPRPSPALTRRASAVHNLWPIPLAYLFAELVAGENPQERIVAYAKLSDIGPAVFIKLGMTSVLGNGRAS